MKFKQIKMVKLLKLLLLIFTFFTQQIISNYISIDLNVDKTQINIQATYTFSFSRDINPLTSDFVIPSTIPTGSVIQIVFPNNYLSIAKTSVVPCTDFQTGIALICQISSSSHTITIKNYYTNSSQTNNIYPSIQINSIINPSKSGQTGNFEYYIKDSLGISIDQGPSASNSVYSAKLNFSPGQFQSCKISAQGATILTRSKLYISLSPKNQIPSSGQLFFQFPLFWSNDMQSNKILTTSPNCAALSNISGSLSCSYTTISSPVNKIYITVTGITTSSLSAPFSLSIQSLLTPPFIDSSESITISSQWSDGSRIDLCSTKVTDLTAIKFQSATFQSTSNTLVQSPFIGKLSLSLAKPFSYEDVITFTLPSFFMSATINSLILTSFTQSKDTSASTITLSNFPSTSSKSTNSLINFNFQNIINPTSIKPVTLIASFYRAGSLYQQSSIEYVSTAGTATYFQLRPNVAFVSNKGNAQLQIQTSLNIPIGSKIKISYPSTVTVPDLSSNSLNSATLNGISVGSASFAVASNTIIFSNIFQSLFTGGTILLDFKEFQNPPTVQPSIYLLVVQSSDGFVIFTSSYTITGILKGFISNSVSSSTYKVLSTSVITAQIQLNFLATTIVITVPSDIIVKSGFETTCLPNSLTSCSISGNSLTFEGNFLPGIQQISWGNNINPNSFQPTQTFSMFAYNRGWGTEKSLGFLYLQMKQTTTFSSILVAPSSLKNNDKISISLTINFPSESPSQGQLSVVIPNDLDLSLASCSIACTKIANTITFNILTFTSHLQVNLINVVNAPSYKPISDITFSFINSNGHSSLYQAKSAWTNNIPSTFVTAISTDSGYRGQNAKFKISLTGLSGKQTYTVFKFSDLFGALTSAPIGTILLNPRSVRFDIINQTFIDLSITLVTPQSFGDYTFSMSTYIEENSISYLIGQSTSNIWHHSCYNTLCKSCDNSNNSKCIDCYPLSISQYYILDTSQQTCARACTSGYYMTNGNICSPCFSNCLQCAAISTNCTSCDPAKSLFLDKNYKKCVSKCEDGYYANIQINQCRTCVSPCLYCGLSATKCTYCEVGKFWLNDDCWTNCPSTGYYIQNSVTRKCDLCNSNCLTCQNSISKCTSCNKTLLLFLQSSVCVSKCQANSFIDYQLGQCVPCKSPCNLCFNESNVCSTCLSTATTPIWYNFGCITSSACPIGNYVNVANRSCDSCPKQCTSCSSLIACTSCSINFALYQSKCLNLCPKNTYQDNKVCLPCTGCQTCTANYTNCTSCISNQFLYYGKCYVDCPSGTYKNTTLKTCQPCTSDCPTCKNSTFCLTCVTDLYLYVGKCQLLCPISTYETSSSISGTNMKICQACPQKCYQCTSISSCQSCQAGYSLQNDTMCVTTCSRGISYNQICYPCGLNCSNCQQLTQTCNLCDTNYYISQGKCVNSCPSNMLSLNNISCVSCTLKFAENCTTCNFNQCLSCSEGQLIKGQCQPCQDGFFSRSSKCAKCPSSCRSCYNYTNCIACADKFYMEQNYCTDICPLNKIPNGTVCTICMNYCSICNQLTSLCSVCSSGYYLYESRCVNQCPSPLIVNLDGTKCVSEEQFYQQYSKQAKIVYFPFSIGGIIIFILCIVIKCYSPLTHLLTISCSVVSIVEIGSWAAFLYVEYSAFSNYHSQSLRSLVLAVIGICMIFILAFVQIKFYCKYLTTDALFQKWQSKNFIIDKFFLTLSTILNFKIYRIIHSRLLQRQQFSMKLMTVNKLKPFSLISIISLVICSIPVGVGTSLALYFSIAQDQEFFAALDCLTITSIMILLTILDLRHQSTYFFVQVQSSNLKRQIYEQDSYKLSVDGQSLNPLDQKNMSKGQLLEAYVRGQLPQQSAMKLKGQNSLFVNSNTMKQTQTRTQIKKQNSQPKNEIQENEISQINLDNQEIQFEQVQQQGDQGVLNHYQTGSQKNLLSQKNEQQSDEQIQESELQVKKVQSKWVEKKFDRFGYLIKINEEGVQQSFDQNGYRIGIDDEGAHHKYDQDGNEVQFFMGEYYIKDSQGFYHKDGKIYDSDGNEVQMFMGQYCIKDSQGFYHKDGKMYDSNENEVQMFMGEYCIKDSQGFYHKDGKKYDKRGYQVRENQQGQIQYFDDEGFKIQQDQDGNVKRYDQHGFFIQKDQNGNIHSFTPQGYQAFISDTGKITYKDKDGNFVRKTSTGVYQMYDPDDGFKIVKTVNQEGEIISQKYDKNGYRIQKDKWGNIYRYDEDGYRVVLGPGDMITRYDKNGYEVRIGKDGKVRLFDQEGYEVIIDENGKKKFYDQNGYEVIRDYDGQVTLFDKNGYQVIINQQTGEHVRYTAEGLKVVYDQDGKAKLIDKRGHEVVQLQDGFYQKYDQVGNKIVLDQFGFEVEFDQENIDKIRYDKVGNLVNELEFERKIQQEQQRIQRQGQNAVKTIKRFKPSNLLDFQTQYSKMVQQQNNQIKEEQLSEHQENFHQFHDIEQLNRQQKDFQDQLLKLRQQQLQNQILLPDQDYLVLNQLQEVDHNPQTNLRQKDDKNKKTAGKHARYKEGSALQKDSNQDYIQIKSIADASINERSFQNQGVQPIDINDSQYSQLESLDQLSPNLGKKTKRKRGQHSQMSFINGQQHDTKTEYNHKKVNVQIKNKNIYDQNEDIQSLHEQNWAQNAQGGMFNNYRKDFSNANTNTHVNQLIFMDDVQDQNDTLSNFMKQKSNRSHNNESPNRRNKRYQGYQDRNTIEQMQNQLFDEGIKERTQFKLSNGPNPLVEYARNLQINKKSIKQRMYLEQTHNKRKKRR